MLSEEQDKRVRVFISYSRKDEAFTLRLSDALARRGFAPDFDQSTRDPTNIDTGIAAEDEWWQRLKDMITAAEVLVFVVSLDSVASRWCDEEIGFARAMGKRIIPIRRRLDDNARLPPRLTALNIKIDFTDDGDEQFASSLDALASALRLDVAWHRECARLTVLAARWDAAGRSNNELLLSVADARAVGALLESRRAEMPAPSDLLVAMRDASYAWLDAEDRRQRTVLGRAFVKPAEEALQSGDAEHATRISVTGMLLADDARGTLIPELQSTLARSMFDNRTLAVLHGHTAIVETAEFNRDDTLLVTASRDETARIWHAATGEAALPPLNHEGWVTQACFFNEHDWVLTSTARGDLTIWDAADGEKITSWNSGNKRIDFIRLSAGDDLVAFYNREGGYLNIFQMSSEEQFEINTKNSELVDAKFSPDEKCLLIASANHDCSIWNIEDLNRPVLVHRVPLEGNVTSVDWLADNGCFAVATAEGTASLVDIRRPTQLRSWQAGSRRLTSLRASRTRSKFLTTSFDHTASVWDSVTGSLHATLRGHEAGVLRAQFSRCERRVVTASNDYTARVFDVSRVHFTALPGNASETWAGGAALSRDKRYFFAWRCPKDLSANETTGVIQNAETGEVVAAVPPRLGHVRDVIFSSTGDRLLTIPASINPWPEIREGPRVWEAATGRELGYVKARPGLATGFSPNGEFVVSAGAESSAIKIYSAETGEQVQALHCNGAFPDRAVLAESKPLAVLSERRRRRLVVWNYLEDRKVADVAVGFREAECLAISLDGNTIAAGLRRGLVMAWDVHDQKLLLKRRIGSSDLREVCFNRDASRVACCDSAGRALVLAIAGDEQCRELRGHRNGASRIALSPDGRRAATIGDDGTLRIWECSSGIEIARLRSPRYADSLATTFSACGDYVLHGPAVIDVSRTAGLTGRQRIPLVVSTFAGGLGKLQFRDKEDILMSQSPEDLFELMLSKTTTSAESREILRAASRVLRHQRQGWIASPLHANCYLTESQFDEKFRRTAAPSATPGQVDTSQDLQRVERYQVTSAELAGQEFHETHAGIPIFRLANGRYHVVSHFAVASLPDARLAAEELARLAPPDRA